MSFLFFLTTEAGVRNPQGLGKSCGCERSCWTWGSGWICAPSPAACVQYTTVQYTNACCSVSFHWRSVAGCVYSGWVRRLGVLAGAAHPAPRLLCLVGANTKRGSHLCPCHGHLLREHSALPRLCGLPRVPLRVHPPPQRHQHLAHQAPRRVGGGEHQQIERNTSTEQYRTCPRHRGRHRGVRASPIM